MATVAEHVAVTLAKHIHHVFGVMGNGNAHFLDALERITDAVYTAVRHEAGGVVAADAHYRAGGGIAAATSTYGAGFTNTLTALTEAAQARIPLVLVAGDAPTTGFRPWDIDQSAIATVVGAPTFTVTVEDAAATTVRAIEHALLTGGPVVLAIPYDLPKRDAGPIPDLPAPQKPVPAELQADGLEAVAALAQRFATAQRPFLLAGRGAWLADASDCLGALADATGALTASTALGRGVFPDSRYDLGVVGGFGAEGALEHIREADVAIVVGASLNQFTMRFGALFGPHTHVVQVDTADGPTHPRVNEVIRGDAAVVTAALVAALRELDAPAPSWRTTIDIAAARARDLGEEVAPDGRLDPRTVAARIAELLPEDRVVVSDGGHFIGWANMYWPVASPDRMVMVGTAFQSIGLGFPSVPGAARANPSATIVLTTGDGGGLMAIADLDTAVRSARGRGLAVVWNDCAYGAEVNLYGVQGLAETPMLIDEVDFAAFARAAGADGVVIRSLRDLDRLAEWTQEPIDERPFLLLDLRVSTHVIAPYQREIIAINS